MKRLILVLICGLTWGCFCMMPAIAQALSVHNLSDKVAYVAYRTTPNAWNVVPVDAGGQATITAPFGRITCLGHTKPLLSTTINDTNSQMIHPRASYAIWPDGTFALQKRTISSRNY